MIFAHAGIGGSAAFGRQASRIGRAALYPGSEVGDLLVGKFFALGRHLQVYVGVANGLNQQAIVGFAGNEGRAGISAVPKSFACVQHQTALHLVRVVAVTLVAFVDENGPDAAFEELQIVVREFHGGDRFGCDRRRSRCCRERRRHNQGVSKKALCRHACFTAPCPTPATSLK